MASVVKKEGESHGDHQRIRGPKGIIPVRGRPESWHPHSITREGRGTGKRGGGGGTKKAGTSYKLLGSIQRNQNGGLLKVGKPWIGIENSLRFKTSGPLTAAVPASRGRELELTEGRNIKKGLEGNDLKGMS